MTYKIAAKRIGELSITVGYWHPVSWTSPFGCQGQVASYLGHFRTLGATLSRPNWKNPVVEQLGRIPQTGGFVTDPGSSIGVPPKVRYEKGDTTLSQELIRDVVWEDVVKSIRGGCVVFSDRVNRGSPMSPSGPLCEFGLLPATCAALAAWLVKRPDLGTVVSTPVFHNPNYASFKGFGLCQLWVFFPKNRLLLQPGKEFTTPEVLDHEEFAQEYIHMVNRPEASKHDLFITYDSRHQKGIP